MGNLKLENGSRVAVIGGGPAGSFFSYFLLDIAGRADKDLRVDIYESRDFDRAGPAGCNNCGGIISEWLVQALSADGINLPTNVVERGIDSYVLHMDIGDVRIETPLHEKRIAAVHRGAGPRGIKEIRFRGFDSYLLEQARNRGAHVVPGRVDGVELRDGRPYVKIQGGQFQGYDLMAVAMGKNTPALKMFEQLNFGYHPPRTSKTYIAEIYLGQKAVAQYLGSSMHVFLLNLPRLEFAALIPKGDYATLCLLGEDIDRDLVRSFLDSLEVKQCLPPDWVTPPDLCHCAPSINVQGAVQPFADRIVFMGDCGVTRLYKDGIGAAYRTAKAAAVTAIFEGVSAEDFRRHYSPLLQNIATDNMFGRVLFMVTRVIQRVNILRRGVLRMVSSEQQQAGEQRRMSTVLWDTFTGSAPYREVFMRTLHPAFWIPFLWDIAAGIFSFTSRREHTQGILSEEGLGKVYRDGDVIVRQGESGDCMFVVQAGQVEVLHEHDGKPVRLAVRGEGDFFGEMSLVEREVRSATVRALGEARVLTIDKQTFLRRVHEDPSLAYRILQKMSQLVRGLSDEVTEGKAEVPAHIQPEQTQEVERGEREETAASGLSKVYKNGEVIIRQGEADDCMYVLQSGQVEVVRSKDGKEVQLAVCAEGDFIGEMAIFQREVRSATVRALGETRVLVLQKTTFLRQVHEDPSLAFRMLQRMSRRIRELDSRLVGVEAGRRAMGHGPDPGLHSPAQ
jgi:CRP-like cAMP-binding protein/flavin-dependent dehydrogenase